MPEQWFPIGSDKFDSASNEGQLGHTIQETLDGTDFWYVFIAEVHWLIIDLGQSYTLTKIRGRSRYWGYGPSDVDIYVSNNKANWGTPVATGISSFQYTLNFQEENLIEKSGRYVKIVINATPAGSPGNMAWGHAFVPFTIFELFGEVAPVPYPTSRLRKDVIHGYNCFTGAYVAAKIGGFVPLKLPDGTVF